MVKTPKKNTNEKRSSKGFKTNGAKAKKINASTTYETCTERISPFGGLLAVIKFLDLIKFHDIFLDKKPRLGISLNFMNYLLFLSSNIDAGTVIDDPERSTP